MPKCLKNIDTHTITACRLAARLWFPSAGSRSQGQNGGRAVVRQNRKREKRRRNREEKTANASCGLVNPANQREV